MIRAILLFSLLYIFSSIIAAAQINPWIQSNLYDSRRWDTAGRFTATNWLHPPEYTPDQEWGVLSGKWRTTPSLFGSYGGFWDKLEEKGVQVIVAYFGQLATNPSGGERKGASWKGDINGSVFLDLERLVGWKRGYFLYSISYINPGKSLSLDYIGNFFPVQLDNGDDDGSFRIVHLVFGQQLFNNTTEIVLGRLITGEDFAFLSLACTSLNQGICGNPIAGKQSITFPVYPFAAWGARIKVKPHSDWYAQIGTYLVYEGIFNSNTAGIEFKVPNGSGFLTLGEVGYIVGNYKNVPGLPGIFKLGSYYDSERLEDLDSGRNVDGTWGIYIMGQQMLYSENGKYTQGLSAFLALSYAPENRNIITFMTSGGLSYQGLIPSRSQDTLAFIFAYGLFSDDLNEFNRNNGDPNQDAETILELNYRIQVAPWLFVQPDVQAVINPDGRSDIDDALVIGFGIGTVL
ncbi:MAG: hypothetical protein DHS20C13_13040 [Thermodesulfobacteriota bacterium]|nr:MAG: hypothetical protein DHS20C13_13040 [Thermodesulfobacteriota bacterium]